MALRSSSRSRVNRLNAAPLECGQIFPPVLQASGDCRVYVRRNLYMEPEIEIARVKTVIGWELRSKTMLLLREVRGCSGCYEKLKIGSA